MDIRITTIKAKEILEMFSDWDEKVKQENRERYDGYIDGVKEVLSVLGITKSELKELSKK